MSLLTKQFKSREIKAIKKKKNNVRHCFCIMCQISYLSHFAIGAFKEVRTPFLLLFLVFFPSFFFFQSFKESLSSKLRSILENISLRYKCFQKL